MHARAYGDVDAVVAMFARAAGRVTVFARGARAPKKNATPIMPTHELSLDLIRRPGSDMLSARTMTIANAHARLTQDLVRLSAANVLCELLREMFHDGEQDARIYDVAAHTLAELETADPIVTLVAFEHTLLVALGVATTVAPDFRVHTRMFEDLRGKALPARDFLTTVMP